MKGLAFALSAMAFLAGCSKHPAPSIEHTLPWYKDMPPVEEEDVDSSSDVAQPDPVYNPPVIYFAFDSDSLGESEWGKLVDMTLHIKGHCTVAGYASPEGDAQYNLALSRRRAQKVTEYINRTEIPVTLGLMAWGAEKTVDNGYPDRYWMDRRVDVTCQ